MLLFVCGVAVPVVLFLVANSRDLSSSRPVEVRGVLQLQSINTGHDRKPLDYSESKDSIDTLEFQIEDMKRIKVSVQNELRELEKERSNLYKNVQTSKDSLTLIKKQVSIAKTELQEARSKLARVQRESNPCRGQNAPTPVNQAPIVVVNMPPTKKSTSVGQSLNTQNTHSCTFQDCFDYSRCSLSKSFSIYIYNLHSPFNARLELQQSDLLNPITASISDKHSVTSDPNDACVFLLITDSKTATEVELLPHWGQDGSNHVVLDLSYGDVSLLRKQPVSKAVYASVFALRTNYDITLTPVLRTPPTHLWKGLPPHLPAFRSVFLYFEGEFSESKVDSRLGTNDAWIASSDIQFIHNTIRKQSTDNLRMVTSCKKGLITDDPANSHAEHLGEWKLCGDFKYRSSNLTVSTYALILGSRTGLLGAATYSRLIEALQFGSIPVLLGVNSLPFDPVIDWTRAAVAIPASRVGELHYILRAMQPNTVLEYRRQGRFLWETYFSSASSIVDAVLAIIRYRAYHPPPSAKDYLNAKSLISLRGSLKEIPSPAFQQNFSVYSTELWNHPPGPFLMYPLTPFTTGPVSGSQYQGLSRDQLTQLPPHVIQAGGITGPFFQDYLLGNTPPEQFTIVMLTYERNEVLMEALRRLDNLDGLAKVVVVWNSPSPPTGDLMWPSISAPLEVCLCVCVWGGKEVYWHLMYCH